MDHEEDETDALLDGRPFVRRLVHHSESESLFEVTTDLEWESCAENGCDDVTDIEEFERKFSEEQSEKQKRDDKFPKIRTH